LGPIPNPQSPIPISQLAKLNMIKYLNKIYENIYIT